MDPELLNGLDTDFSGEFAENMLTAMPALTRRLEREFSDEVSDDDVRDALGLGRSTADKGVPTRESQQDAPRQAAAPAPAPDDVQPDAPVYDPADRSLLETNAAPAAGEGGSALEAELARERGYREALEKAMGLLQQQPGRQAAPATYRPTGIPEVDEALESAGLLDRTGAALDPVKQELAEMSRRMRQIEEQRRAEQTGRQLVAQARARVAQVVKVFRDVPVDHLVEAAVRDMDPLTVARQFYKATNCLGADGFPARHPSEVVRKAMPQARGEATANRAGGRGAAEQSMRGWSPTQDPEERRKRLSEYRH